MATLISYGVNCCLHFSFPPLHSNTAQYHLWYFPWVFPYLPFLLYLLTRTSLPPHAQTIFLIKILFHLIIVISFLYSRVYFIRLSHIEILDQRDIFVFYDYIRLLYCLLTQESRKMRWTRCLGFTLHALYVPFSELIVFVICSACLTECRHWRKANQLPYHRLDLKTRCLFLWLF